MSQQRVSPDAGFRPPDRDSQGRPLCRRCGAVVKSPRRAWCSDECVHQHKVRSQPGYVRRCIFERDHGICALCGLDTVKATSQHRKLMDRFKEIEGRHYGFVGRIRDALAKSLKFSPATSFWAADHILPVSEGGGECGLENYRTLCLGCHADETRLLSARRRLSRRSISAASGGQGSLF